MSMRTLLRNPQVPASIKHAFKFSIISESAEQALWREAVVRHTLDALGIVEHGDTNSETEAQDWFRKCPEDVALAFEFAGVDPAPILKELLK